MVKMLESRAVKAVDNPESEPEVDDNSESEPEVDAESVSQQEKIFPQPMEVEKLPVETLVCLSAEPTLELVSPFAGMGVSFFLEIA